MKQNFTEKSLDRNVKLHECQRAIFVRKLGPCITEPQCEFSSPPHQVLQVITVQPEGLPGKQTLTEPHTLDDGQQDDNDKEEEGDIKEDAVKLIRVACRVLDFIPDATTGPHTHIHVEQVALKGEQDGFNDTAHIVQNKIQFLFTFTQYI